MAFQLLRRTRGVMLMVLAWPESGFQDGAARLRGPLPSFRMRCVAPCPHQLGAVGPSPRPPAR